MMNSSSKDVSQITKAVYLEKSGQQEALIMNSVINPRLESHPKIIGRPQYLNFIKNLGILT